MRPQDKHIERQSALPLLLRLAAEAAMVFSLTSCQWLGIPDPFKEQRPDQVVEGPRHAPALNPQTVPPEPESRGYVQGTQPPQIQPYREGINPQYYNPPYGDNSNASNPGGNGAPNPNAAPANNSAASSPAVRRPNNLPPSPENDPFDYYDEHGNPVKPSAGGDQSQNNQPQQSGIDTMFSSDDGNNIRKRLPGNPPDAYNASEPGAPRVVNPSSYVSLAPTAGDDDTDESAPAQWPSQSPRDNHGFAVNSSNIVSTGNVSRGKADNNMQAAPPSAPANEAESSKPSWFQRWFGKYSGNEQDPARNAPTPDISSVPPTPTEFQAIKNEKVGDMQDLQGDHIGAEQEKQQLDSEPAQPQAAAPVVAPGDNATAAGQPVNQPVTPPANSDQPVLLGHASADSPAPSDTGQGLKMPSSYVLPPPVESKASPENDDYVSALQRNKQQPPAGPASAAAMPAAPAGGDAGIGGYQVDPSVQQQQSAQ